MNTAYLCLGANLGNCPETFSRALRQLEENGILIHCLSNIYVSQAWGMTDAPDFFNQVAAVKTSLSAAELLALLLQSEKELGRERKDTGGYASRTIDIDILFFNDEIIRKEGLQVPHPRVQHRRFALRPLCDIAPGLVHPVLKKTVRELLGECADPSKVQPASHAI